MTRVYDEAKSAAGLRDGADYTHLLNDDPPEVARRLRAYAAALEE